MDNATIADAFTELADRLALTDLKPYRYLAYRTAADAIRHAPVSVAVLAKEGRVRELDGVGDAIARKIDDLIASGTFDALESARHDVPDGMLALTRVDGIGTKTARRLWSELGATSFTDVVEAARDGRLAALPRMGDRIASAVLAHAASQAGSTDASARVLRDDVAAALATLRATAGEAVDGLVEVHAGGEYARGAEQVEQLDALVVATDPDLATAQLGERLAARGWQPLPVDPTAAASTLVAANGLPVHIVACSPADAARAFLELVGPAAYAHAVIQAGGPPRALDARAVPEDALPDAVLHAAHGIATVAVELRDLDGVLDDASLRPPDLVSASDLVAELHCHSSWSDGRRPIIEMAMAARDAGLRIIAITDHSAPYAMVNGLDADRLRAQRAQIDAANIELGGDVTVLQGIEVEVLADGSLGLSDEVLATLDWVVASIHSSQRQEASEIAARMQRVLANPLVDCIGHPSSRLIGRRPPTALDMEWLVEQAARHQTILEINANPRRLDLSATHARQALAAGVLLAINTDAHSPEGLELREHGVATARRAGARRSEVVNCLGTVDELMAIRPRNRA